MIKQIKLKNFKLHKNTTVNFDKSLSIVTGENNSGKTSLLESFLIFEECYNFTRHQIKTANSLNVKNDILSIGHFDFETKFISEFKTVRSRDYYEIFFQDSKAITIEILFEVDKQILNIGFKIEKARNGTAYKISSMISNEDLIFINNQFPKLDFLIFIKSSPISSILQHELFVPKVQIEEELAKGNNLNIMRNRLRLIDITILDGIQRQIATILGYESFEFKLKYNSNTDLYIKTYFKINEDSKYQDLALLGSGVLQLIEILISVNLSKEIKYKIILLDEPDSHLHRLAQQKLVDTLRQTTSVNIQIVLTTHNEQLVSSARSGELLHMYNDEKMEVSPIVANFKSGRGKGFIENSSRNDIYNSLGVSSSAMQFLEAIESDTIVLVEGRSDALYLEALQYHRENLPFSTVSNKKVSFWSIGSITDLPNKMKYWKDILDNIKNKSSLWEKSILLLDLDFMSLDEMGVLKEELFKNYNIEMIYWKSYTIETIILEDINIFCNSFSKVFTIEREVLYTFVKKYLDDISLDDYKSKISSQRTQREKSYEVFSNNKLKLNDGNNYSKYIKLLENSDRLSSLIFKKDDIYELFRIIFKEFNIDIDLENERIIESLFCNIESSTWQTNWNDILDKIYK